MGRPRIKQEIDNIKYNLRYICNIHIIESYKNVTLFDFISPVKYDTFYILPPLLEIIDFQNVQIDILQEKLGKKPRLNDE